MWVSSIRLDGLELELDEVLADVVIRHGRNTIDDGPTASTIQIRLIGVDRAFSGDFRVGVPLELDADGVRRFTGAVTDAALDDDELTIIGAGALSTLSRYLIGAVPWPAEKWHLRVERAFTEAGILPLLRLEYDSDFDPVLVARGAELEPLDQVDLWSYVGELAETIGAAVADLPDGRILIQELSGRTQDPRPTWEKVPSSLAWNETDPATSWEEATSIGALDPSAPAPLEISPADVAYVPVWEMADAIENVSTIGYGADLFATVRHESSIERYGERPGGIETAIANLADAQQRADERSTRRAFPRWVISSVALLRGFPLSIGQLVGLAGFPASSPHESWRPVLEGWTDTIAGDSWTCELAVSDPLLSGVTLLWADVDPSIAWNEVNPATSWIEVSGASDLTTTKRGNYAEHA